VPISSTEVAVTFGGQIAAMHSKFRWELYDMEERARCEESLRLRRLRADREGKPLEDMPAAQRPERSLRDLLEAIFDADTRYIEYTNSRPQRRRI
jgi:hypothetical protein